MNDEISGTAKLRVLILTSEPVESDPLRQVFDIPAGLETSSAPPDSTQAPFDIESVICAHESRAVTELKMARKNKNHFAAAFISRNNPEQLSQSAEKFRVCSPHLEIILIVDDLKHFESIASEIMPAGKLHFLKRPVHPAEIHHMAVNLGTKWLNERRFLENEKLTVDLAAKIDLLEKEIQKRKMIEAGIQKSREIFYSFLRHLPAIAFIKDCKGRYVYINEACYRLLNIKPIDFIGKTDTDIWPGPIAERIMDADKRTLREQQNFSNIDHFEIDGEDKYFKTTRFSVLKKGKPYFLAGISFDVTDEAKQDLLMLNQLLDANPEKSQMRFKQQKPSADKNSGASDGSNQNDIPDALPGLNVKTGLERLGGALNLYIDLVSFLCKDKKMVTREIREMVHQKEFGPATVKAHSLKGSAATVAAEDLTTVARALEKACGQQQENEIHDLLETLEQKLAQVSDSSDALVRMFPESAPIEELKRIQKKDESPLGVMDKLTRRLEECDPLGASDYIEKLASEIESRKISLSKPDVIEMARERIKEYDFDTARECIIEIKKDLKNSIER